jgi:hypothetical protein
VTNVSVREHESWWWVRPTEGHRSSVCAAEALVRRAQRIYGGQVEVIHQTTTTVAETTVIPPGVTP